MDEFLVTLENLVAYFVQRQRIVVLAMLDIHPTVLGHTAQRLLGINLEVYQKVHREKRNSLARTKDDNAIRSLFDGVWKNEWQFFRHGGGCKLTHLRTGEPIEWDAPDPQAITTHRFLDNLAWRLNNDMDDPFVSRCQQWLEEEHCGLNDVKQVLYIMIDKGILFLKLDHTCCLASQRDVEQYAIPDTVAQAAKNLITYYKQRQQIVIDAMVELRPDIIRFRSEARFLDAAVAARLRELVKNGDIAFQGWTFTKGELGNGSWDYELGHTRLTITNKITHEPLTWAASDPSAVELDGFHQHLLWCIKYHSDDENIKACANWQKAWTQTYHPKRITSETENWLFHPWTLLDILAEQQIIVLKQDEYGVMIK
jgi:hypothetical protein